jgi:hypothetical protein
MADFFENASSDSDQIAFMEKVALAYSRSIQAFCADLISIAQLESEERLPAIKGFHESFGERAPRFLSDLSQALASIVRQETRVPAVRGTTTANLAVELLTEACGDVLSHLTKQSNTADRLSHEAAYHGATAASTSIFAEAIIGGATGAALGRILGGSSIWAAGGTLAGLQQGIFAKVSALLGQMSALINRVQILDDMLRGFLLSLESNAGKLFDWVGTKTFGSAVNLELIGQAARQSTELLRTEVLPSLPQFSIVLTMREIQEREKALFLEHNLEKYKRLKDNDRFAMRICAVFAGMFGLFVLISAAPDIGIGSSLFLGLLIFGFSYCSLHVVRFKLAYRDFSEEGRQVLNAELEARQISGLARSPIGRPPAPVSKSLLIEEDERQILLPSVAADTVPAQGNPFSTESVREPAPVADERPVASPAIPSEHTQTSTFQGDTSDRAPKSAHQLPRLTEQSPKNRGLSLSVVCLLCIIALLLVILVALAFNALSFKGASSGTASTSAIVPTTTIVPAQPSATPFEPPAKPQEAIEEPNPTPEVRRALPIESPSPQPEVRRAEPVEPEAVPTATPSATSQILSSEQATAAFNWLQDRLQKPHAKRVSYDSPTDAYTWIGPKYGQTMSMPRSQFEAEIWVDYLKSHRTETSTASQSGSGDLLAQPDVRKAQPVHRVLKYHTDVWAQEPDGHWVHIQKAPYWADE